MESSLPLTARRPRVGVCVAMAIGAMMSVQTGAAVSTWMFAAVGPVGAAFLRLALAAAFLLAICRPNPFKFSKSSMLSAIGLGLVSCCMTLFYFQAINLIPLGTASTLEYLGPFTIAVIGLKKRRDLVWPVLALAGVVMLTTPWAGEFNPVGIAYGLAAGASLGGYVVLSQRVGDSFSGMQGLAISLTVAAITASFFGAKSSINGITITILIISAVSAILLPLLPYALEMQALRGMTTSSFSTLMSFEPGFACVIGFVLLGQQLSFLQFAGIALVVIAGVGAVRRGQRTEPALA
ncbi:EamA family transporter [Saccharopolyspora spinosa]|uniref:EamA family transporter n=2 Tax=Saccharopolyspora spinosa TaxID=60894 RepID=UPI0005C8F180